MNFEKKSCRLDYEDKINDNVLCVIDQIERLAATEVKITIILCQSNQLVNHDISFTIHA